MYQEATEESPTSTMSSFVEAPQEWVVGGSGSGVVPPSRGRSRGVEPQQCRKYTPSTRDTYPFPNPYPHVNTVTMSELITTSSAYIINGDSPMTSVANTVAMTTFAVHTLQPLIFYSRRVREGGLVLGGIFFANGPLGPSPTPL